MGSMLRDAEGIKRAKLCAGNLLPSPPGLSQMLIETFIYHRCLQRPAICPSKAPAGPARACTPLTVSLAHHPSLLSASGRVGALLVDLL
jgi:hypothetical protein